MIGAGEQAPPLVAHDEAGNRRTFAFPALVVFLKTTCPTCQFALPYLKRLPESSPGLLAVSQDPPSTTQRFAARFGAELPYCFDPAEAGYSLSNAFGITHVPTLFLIDSRGKVETVIEGFDKLALEDLGIEFLPEEKLPLYKPG
ncbi:MAG: TlpA disulfide reductase family protein [Bryobacter sp.]|nr:TlpA disulfide reductase family protein [Bryobacter sp.]